MQREGSVLQYVLFWQILLGWPRCTSGSRLDFLQRYAKGTGYAKTYLESLLNVQVFYPVKYWLKNTHHVCVDRLDIESELSILNLSYRSICLSINYKVFQMKSVGVGHQLPVVCVRNGFIPRLWSPTGTRPCFIYWRRSLHRGFLSWCVVR